MFGRFWSEYPRKIHRENAYKLIKEMKPDGKTMDCVLAALKAYKESENWKNENGRFIPAPDKWLSDGQWKDPPKKAGGSGFMVCHDDYLSAFGQW